MFEIITARLRLSRLDLSDAAFIYHLYNTQPFIEFIGDKNLHSIEDAERMLLQGPIAMYREQGFGLWRGALKDCDTPIGICGLLKRETLPDVDLGYGMLPQYWGQGFAFEAADAVLRYARDRLHLERLAAITSKDNESSIRLLKRLGMTWEMTLEPQGSGSEPVELFAIAWP